MTRFEVIIRLRISDRPDYELLHAAMKTLGLCSEGNHAIDGTLRYSYAENTTADALLNLIVQAISPIQKRFAVFVYDRENRKSAGSVN